MEKEENYTLEDRREIFNIQLEIFKRLADLYKKFQSKTYRNFHKSFLSPDFTPSFRYKGRQISILRKSSRKIKADGRRCL